MHQHRGFTLIEIMIALAVFATVSVALVRSATIHVNQARIINERTLAHWMAENRINEYRALERSEENYPSNGTDRQEIEMAGQEFEVVTEVESTENPNVRRLVVSVYRDSDLDKSIYELAGFLGRY